MHLPNSMLFPESLLLLKSSACARSVNWLPRKFSGFKALDVRRRLQSSLSERALSELIRGFNEALQWRLSTRVSLKKQLVSRPLINKQYLRFELQRFSVETVRRHVELASAQASSSVFEGIKNGFKSCDTCLKPALWLASRLVAGSSRPGPRDRYVMKPFKQGRNVADAV